MIEKNKQIKGQSHFFLTTEKKIEDDLLQLLSYFKNLPKSLQKTLSQYFFALKERFPQDEKIKELQEVYFKRYKNEPCKQILKAEMLIKVLMRLLSLNDLSPIIEKIADQIRQSKQEGHESDQILSENVVRIRQKQRLNLLNPHYDMLYKLSKEIRQKPNYLPVRSLHPNKRNPFLSEPRLLERMEELAHFQSNTSFMGNILYFQYQGNSIQGRNTYAVVNGTFIDIYQRETQIPHYFFELATSAGSTPNVISEEEEQHYKPKKKQVSKTNKKKKQEAQCLDFYCRLVGHKIKVTCLALSKDQLYLISASQDRTIKLWCLRLKRVIAEYKGHTKIIWDVSFNPSGYYFASGSGDGLVMVWKTDVPNPQRIFIHGEDVYKVSFAKDPSFMISAGENCTIKIWNIAQTSLIKCLQYSKPIFNFNIQFSGEKLIAIESDGKISIHNILKDELIKSFYIRDPDGKNLKTNEQSKEEKKLIINDGCFAENEKELVIISSHYVIIYQLDRLESNASNTVLSIYEDQQQKPNQILPKEVIFMGKKSHLTFCTYIPKNILVIAGKSKSY